MEVDKEKFRAWLVKHALDPVGLQSSAYDCAFARFFKEEENAVGVVVGRTGHTLHFMDKTPVRGTNSDWMKQFIVKFDNERYRAMQLSPPRELTGAECLALL